MNKLSIFFFLNLFFLTSCLGGSDYYRDRVAPFLKKLKADYKPQMVDGVMEPAEFPNLEEDQKTLVGIDSNQDGVRDDMEIFINRKFQTNIERENLKNEFRRAPNFFRNYKNITLDEFIIYESNSSEDSRCIWSGLKKLGLSCSPELLKYRSSEALYNTKERSSAFSHHSQQLAGRAFGDGFGDKRIMESCREKIDEQLLKKVQGI